MDSPRYSGILLHPTSFSGTPGIGTIGKPAYAFIDWLESAHQSLWQILPLGPTGYGDSPYASFSTFAGNPLLVDLDMLCEQHLLTGEDLQLPEYIHTTGDVDYGATVYWKIPLLQKAAETFLKEHSSEQEKEYCRFQNEHAYWLDEYAVFMDIKNFYDKKAQDEHKDGCRWNNYWPQELATHQANAVDAWKKNHAESIERQKIIQYFFFAQWTELKEYAHRKHISIIGDIPIFAAADSADVWSHQEQFKLDKLGTPTAVAGVPPDYFCATGQLWGNPLYDWDKMEKSGYNWWIQRIAAMANLVDIIRIDHFRGFESYWSVPVTETTAINGTWLPGPGKKLFDTIWQKLGNITILAEDLGIITEKVTELRKACGFPGMKVLQFAFSSEEAAEKGMTNPFLPHMYADTKCIVYTGTHDNDTLKGWLDSTSKNDRTLICRYIGKPNATNDELADALLRCAFASTAQYAVSPIQDILHTGPESRMNTPSTTGRNWTWRMTQDSLTEDKAKWLHEMSELYNRN